MEATGDIPSAANMALRVAKSIAVPLVLGFIVCDGFVTAAWVGMVVRGITEALREHGAITDEKDRNVVALYAALIGMSEKAGADAT